MFLDSTGNVNCKVHPAVIFTILDHFSRRNDGQDRVIGTLLGEDNDGIVEIKNCFPVPHNETADQVMVDHEFHRTMYDLHRKVSTREGIVGWYSTGNAITEHSALLHEFYGREIPMPVHLLVDTSFNDAGKMEVKAYTSIPISLGEKNLGSRFVEVGCKMLVSEAEKIGLDVLLGSGDKITGEGDIAPRHDIEGLEASIEKTQELLKTVSEYIADVQEGKVEGNIEVGRLLADTIAAVPIMKPGVFEKTFHDGLQDLLMVSYLAQMTRTQLALAERIQAVV
jgi:translation initiation factor 3 subunit F